MASQPQLNTAQLSKKMIDNLQKRIAAKTLECASLQQMMNVAPAALGKLFNFRDEDKQKPVRDAVHNYLTAKLNQELVTLEEWEIQLRGWKSALAQMQSGILLPTGVRVGKG